MKGVFVSQGSQLEREQVNAQSIFRFNDKF